MKKAGIGCLIVLVVLAVIIGVALFATSDLPKAADAFFEQVGAGRLDQAYQATAEEFRAATTPGDFEAFMKGSALAEFKSASWSSRSINNNTGKLEGTITTKDGGQIPVEMDLVKESGAWKVLALRKAQAGVSVKDAAPAVPPEADLQSLAGKALALLEEAIRTQDFTAFHGGVSKLWQTQTSPEALKAAFQSFIDLQVDLAPALKQAATFSQAPAINEDGVLVLEGYYAVEPQPVYFTLKYIYEHPRWELLGVNVKQ